MMKTSFYIDGFNLYNRAVINTQYKWLDLYKVCQGLVPKHQVTRIRYFTALVDPRGDPGRPQRQQIYLRALWTIPIPFSVHLGYFRPRQKWRPLVSDPTTFVEVLDTEEKGTDVNIATYMLADAYAGDYEQAVLISNDADLALPISFIKEQRKLPVGIVNPNLDPNLVMPVELSKAATFHRQLRPALLWRSQFPPTLTDSQGVITKPSAW